MIRTAVVGYGYWGPNLARNLAETPGCELVAVADLDPEVLAIVERRFPGVRTTTDPLEILTHTDVDAVAIATPVSTHYELALRALENGKHVWLEKPLAATSEQASRLVDEASSRNRTLLVDHTFVFTPAVRKIHELVEGGALGELHYFDSVRINLGLFQRDVNVIWDLAVHDLSIMDRVLPMKPRAVSATGMSHVPGRPENIAYLTLFFDANLIGHIHVNWLAPVKVRRTLLSGSQKMIVYDDLDQDKLKVYDRGLQLGDDPESRYQMLIGYRSGDMWSPQLEIKEALRAASEHFVACIESGKAPVTDGEAGLRVVRLLEAATRSMQERGQPISLDGGSGA